MVKWCMCQSSESSSSVTSVILKKAHPAWLDMRMASGTQPKSKVFCWWAVFDSIFYSNVCQLGLNLSCVTLSKTVIDACTFPEKLQQLIWIQLHSVTKTTKTLVDKMLSLTQDVLLTQMFYPQCRNWQRLLHCEVWLNAAERCCGRGRLCYPTFERRRPALVWLRPGWHWRWRRCGLCKRCVWTGCCHSAVNHNLSLKSCKKYNVYFHRTYSLHSVNGLNIWICLKVV